MSVVRVIRRRYSNVHGRERVTDQYSDEFGVGIGVHQSSDLSPLLLSQLLEAIPLEIRTGVPLELLYADNLVLVVDIQVCIYKLNAWKASMGSKRLHVNMKKIKFLVPGVGHGMLKKSGSTPVLVAAVVSAITPPSAHSASCGSTRGAVASLSHGWPTQAMSATGVTTGLGPLLVERWLKCMSTAPRFMWWPLSAN